MPNVQTVVVIIKFKSEIDLSMFKRSPPAPFFGGRRKAIGIDITETQTINLDKPLLIIPNGEAETVEVIPITDKTILHGKNIKRQLR